MDQAFKSRYDQLSCNFGKGTLRQLLRLACRPLVQRFVQAASATSEPDIPQ